MGRQQAFVVFLGFLTLHLVLRGFTFALSVVDWDESVYLLMADAWLAGHAPYTSVWDHKPAGVYLLFGAGELLFGHGIGAIRLLAALAASATSLGLAGFMRAVGGSWVHAILAGALYAAFLSAPYMGGLAANTELLMAPFVVGAAWLLATRGFAPGPRAALGAGLLLGFAAQVKYVAALDGVLAGLVLAGVALRGGTRWLPWIGRVAVPFAAGCAAPTALMAAGFAASGHFAPWLDANFLANGRYAAGALRFEALVGWLEQLVSAWGFLAVAVVAAAWSLARRDRADRPDAWVVLGLLAWVGLIVAGLALGLRRFWPHYAVQLLPPLALLAACATAPVVQACTRAGLGAALPLILVLGPPLFPIVALDVRLGLGQLRHRVWRGEAHHEDATGRVAAALERRLGPGDTLWVHSYQPVLHHLLGRPPLTPYVMPAWLIVAEVSRVLPVGRQAAIDGAFAARPTWIVVHPGFFDGRDPVNVATLARIRRDYRPAGEAEGATFYRLPAAGAP